MTFLLTSAGWIVAGILLVGPSVQVSAPANFLAREESAAPARSSRTADAIAGSGQWIIPVAGVERGQLVDTYTQSRGGGARVHNAIDIAAPAGTPIVAAAAGRVEKLFLSNDGGNTVYIRLPGGEILTYYAHLDAYAQGLREGQPVKQGQFIGTVGSTGNADPAAPHLHFAIYRMARGSAWHDTGEPVNPFPLLTQR
uniref:M23 family metallopeptidase n=1 Tax=Porphyrobacter sp. GA68 TaxID=2883480 RepID=UPI001D18F7BB|nr:M23 family metallopeptidase [Porphyrobacter sp. GA68]